jgi:cellulose 1,4-beta-cellobiosidase
LGIFVLAHLTSPVFLILLLMRQYRSNENSRVFLMKNEDEYQMFTLLNNEIAVDIDVSKVGCGLKASLYFVAMDADGGKSKHPTNLAGARYGTGYCDATCPRGNRFIAGKANFEQWEVQYRSEGLGYYGACCAEFDVINANNASYNMASKPCVDLDYTVCTVNECDLNMVLYPERGFPCDAFGCEYQPYRLGNTDFYGQHKTVDTTKNYTVVTRFEEHKITQFFVQNGKRIDLPSPAAKGFPQDNGITEEYCNIKPSVFAEADRFNVVGGFHQHLAALKQPMVLTLTITDDYWVHNLWLDSKWPVDMGAGEGAERGPCSPEGNDPDEVMEDRYRAQAVWSNIRFGPVGSTIKI